MPINPCPPRILVQFDGSSHRLSRKGGAGAALLQVESTGVALLDWGARALPNCADNIVAETHGADLAISLYEKYLYMCQQQGLPPLPLDRIQGDIKPLIQHLDFRGRFRRNDLVPLINQFHVCNRAKLFSERIRSHREPDPDSDLPHSTKFGEQVAVDHMIVSKSSEGKEFLVLIVHCI